MQKNKRSVPKIITILFLLILIITSIVLVQNLQSKEISFDKGKISYITLEEFELGQAHSYTPNISDELFYEYTYNPHYVGYLKFESDLISLPIVQYKDNSYYLKIAIDSTPSTQGTVFVEYLDTISTSQNLTLYGHTVFYDMTKKFSPLHSLMDEENYLPNNLFYFRIPTELINLESYSFTEEELLYQEKNNLTILGEERTYQIVYIAKSTDIVDWPVLKYYLSNYSEQEFATMKSRIETLVYYDTGLELNYEDKFMTFQTCIDTNNQYKLIVIAKEIDSNLIFGTTNP